MDTVKENNLKGGWLMLIVSLIVLYMTTTFMIAITQKKERNHLTKEEKNETDTPQRRN
jgi:preprotein translocase subunit YajC